MQKCKTLSENILLSPSWKIHDGYYEKLVTVFKVPVMMVRAVCVDAHYPDAKNGQLFQIFIRDYDSGHLIYQHHQTMQNHEIQWEVTTEAILNLCSLILLSSVDEVRVVEEVTP